MCIRDRAQGVIEWLKKRYCRKYISSILEKTGEGCNLFEAMKSLSIKDAIYTIAESWDEMKPDTLQKSWHKLWPEVMIESEQIGNEQDTDTAEIVNDLQNLQHDIQVNDIDEWIAKYDEDCETNEELNDDQIVAAILQVDEETVNEDPDLSLIHI